MMQPKWRFMFLPVAASDERSAEKSIGGPPCGASCKACQKDGGKGDEPSRARARAKLASIVAAGGLETDVRTALKAGERSRA